MMNKRIPQLLRLSQCTAEQVTTPSSSIRVAAPYLMQWPVSILETRWGQ